MIGKYYCIGYLHTQTSQIDCLRCVHKFCDEPGLATWNYQHNMLYYIYSRAIPGFIHRKKNYIFTGSYLHTLEISNLLFSQCKFNKRIWRHILYCIQCPRFERLVFKNQTNCNKQKIQCFLRISIISLVTWFLLYIFIRCWHIWKYQKFFLTREIGSIFNVKPMNILYVHNLRLLFTRQNHAVDLIWSVIRFIDCHSMNDL